MTEVDAAARGRAGVQAEVARGGGVARVRTLYRAGYSRHVVDGLVSRGRLERPRRGWVATPGADPLLVAAARHNVVLTCVTAAQRLGLWVLPADDLIHVAAPTHSGRAGSAGSRVHWAQPLLPRHPDALVDSVENVLALVATCQPRENALAVWESALRKGIVDAGTLRRFALPPAARDLLAAAEIWSDSGIETFMVPRLRWMRLPLRRQIWLAGHRVDLLIGDRLVVQADGATHTGAQRDSDIAHDAQLALLGYHVIRVSYHQIVHGWPDVQGMIMRAVAQGLHRAH